MQIPVLGPDHDAFLPGRPCAAEGKSTAGNVGLGVIVVAQLLICRPIEWYGGRGSWLRGGEVVLGIVVGDKTVALGSPHRY